MKKFIVFIITLYQKTISPDHGTFALQAGSCRFYPSCSQYAIAATKEHGPLRGACRAAKRILRCNIFFAGGIDEIGRYVNNKTTHA